MRAALDAEAIPEALAEALAEADRHLEAAVTVLHAARLDADRLFQAGAGREAEWVEGVS